MTKKHKIVLSENQPKTEKTKLKYHLFKLYAWFLCFLLCVAFWLVIISLTSCNTTSGETVPKTVYLNLFNQAKKIKVENDSLQAAQKVIETKFKNLNTSFDSLQAFQKTQIEILQDSLFGFKNISDSTVNDFLKILNNAVIKNIDSLQVRINKNFKDLK